MKAEFLKVPSQWEEEIYYCPDCGVKALRKHETANDGSVGQNEYCFCSSCHSEFFIGWIHPDYSHYGPKGDYFTWPE